MSTLHFADSHNMVAFLEKPAESEGFQEIIDFLKAINGECQLQALVGKKRVIITEASIRRHIHPEDAEGTDCLPTATIFEELARMGRKQRKDIAVTQEETQQDDSVPTPSNDPPLSGEDSMQLSELMLLCTNLQKQVLDLEKAKDAQAKEIADLKKRVQRLEKKKKSRTTSLKRLKKRMSDDADMFDIDDLHSDEVNVDMPVGDNQEQGVKEREVDISVEDRQRIMIELEVPLKRKDQVALDEDLARNLQAQLEAEIIEKAYDKRKKHFAMLRAEEKRRKPPTKAQKRNQMSIYLKNMGGYKHNQLKSKSYEEIQKMFDNEMRRVNTFIPMESEVVKSKMGTEESSKGTEDELEADKSKKAEKTKNGDDKRQMKLKEVEEVMKLCWKKLLVKVKMKVLREFFNDWMLQASDKKICRLFGNNLRNRSRIGINKWYQSFALRNFDLEDMEFESANSNTTAKLPILKLENGNSWVSVPQTAQENGTSVTKMFVPVTAKEKTNKKNDVKARSLLLMALPNEHQLTFSYATSVESLDSIFNRLQKIVSRIAILGVVIAQEDLNLKILSSLPPEWNTHVVVWMNKPKVDTMSIDDLYNNFKIVEQKVKKFVGASSDAKNFAFMTAPSTSNTNDANIASPQVSTASPNVNTTSPQVSTASFNNNVVYAFMVENPNGSNLLHQELEQIHEDELEAMDCMVKIQGQFRNQDNTKKQGNNEDTSSKVMLALDGCRLIVSDKAKNNFRKHALMAVFRPSITYKRGLATVEEQLITYRKNAVLFSEEDAVLKREVAFKDYEINSDEFKSLNSKGIFQDSKKSPNVVCDKNSDDSKKKILITLW
ncbi:hypothetical protein Tco_1011536 [Tanacetum coccineum]